MKKYILLNLLLILASCAPAYRQEDFRCPQVHIPTTTAYTTQVINYSDNFSIEVTGYEGYCYVADTVRRYAVIKPQFKATRLNQNDETDVDFSFYTDVVQGPPEFLGKQIYFASVHIDKDTNHISVPGRGVKVKVPMDRDDLEILLGLNLSKAADIYNKRTFAPLSEDTTTPTEPEAVVEPRPSDADSGCSTCSLKKLFK